MITTLENDPAIRKRYQFWTFGYSTGDPIPYSAHLLRKDLEDARRKLDPARSDAALDRVVIVGHSGGSATAANLMGMMPGLSDADLLVSCPCDLVTWRAGRKAWTQSEDPLRWTDPIKPPVQVVALTGSIDDNTTPELAKHYVDVLQSHGVNARFELVPGANHNAVFRSPMVTDALASLLQGGPGKTQH